MPIAFPMQILRIIRASRFFSFGKGLSALQDAPIVKLEENKRQFFPKATEKPVVSQAISTRLIKLRLVKHQTRNGKVATFSALVVAGNGAGGIGYGFGRDATTSDAIVKAGKIAERNMEFFDRFQGRTIFHAANVKFKATLLMVKPAPASKSASSLFIYLLDTGRRAHHAIQEMCRVMGIDDISCKVYGSTNPLTVVEAFMEALRRQKTPEEVARDSGMKVVDVLKVYQHGMYTATKQATRDIEGTNVN